MLLRNKISILFCVFQYALITASGIRAQGYPEAFSTLDVAISYSNEIGTDRVLRLWSPGVSGNLSVGSPFYLGRLHAGLDLQSFKTRSPDRPSFTSFFVHAGWGFPFRLFKRIRTESGVRIGNYFMAFRTADISGIRNESEFAAGLYQALRIDSGLGFSVTTEVSYTRVYTFLRMNLVRVSAGIVYRFTTPAWLKKVLQQ